MPTEVDPKMNNLPIDYNGKIREGADCEAQIVSDVSRIERDIESHNARHGARPISTT